MSCSTVLGKAVVLAGGATPTAGLRFCGNPVPAGLPKMGSFVVGDAEAFAEARPAIADRLPVIGGAVALAAATPVTTECAIAGNAAVALAAATPSNVDALRIAVNAAAALNAALNAAAPPSVDALPLAAVALIVVTPLTVDAL